MHANEIHENALAGTLLDHNGSTAADLMRTAGLTARMFEQPMAAAVVRAAFKLRDKGLPVDVPTIQATLGDECAQFGGKQFVFSLSESVILANIPFHAEQVRKAAASRAVRAKAHILASGSIPDEECAAFLSECQSELIGVTQSDGTIHDIVMSVMSDIDDKMSGKAETIWPTGIHSLDTRLDGGFRQGELVVIAAYPGKGKSVLMGQIALHCAQENLRSLILSAEMPAKQVARRLLACLSGHELTVFRTKTPLQRDLQNVMLSANKLSALDLTIRACQQMAHAIAEASLWCKRGRGIIAIDYLQRFEGGGDSDSRELAVAAMSRGVKNLALTTLCPVLVGSQLNDDGKLRESRVIGQEADIVLMIDDDQIRVEKNRDGQCGPLKIKANFQQMRFEDVWEK